MYLELQNDDIACFYEDPDLKMMNDYFRFKRYCSPSTAETLCFEAEITKNQFQIPESKLYFHLMADGSLCRVLSEKTISFHRHIKKYYKLFFIARKFYYRTHLKLWEISIDPCIA